MPIPTWTLSVEDFGPIAKADVTLAPFTLLMGKNNTGKSYIAYLLWALLNGGQMLPWRHRYQDKDRPAFHHAISSVLQLSIESGKPEQVRLDEKTQSSFADWMNILLSQEKDKLLGRILSYPKVAIHRLAISPAFACSDIGVTLHPIDAKNTEGIFPSIEEKNGIIEIAFNSNMDILDGINSSDHVANIVAQTLLTGTPHPTRSVGDTVYMPAARTGLMLAYKLLVSRVLDALGLEDKRIRRPTLPLPVIRFLQMINEVDEDPDSEFCPLSQHLETFILGGSISKSKQRVSEFLYRPKGSEADLGLHLTSSLVTELAPFILLLKSNVPFRGIIFEEPEAHLHLEAQILLARALVRLVNAGVQVIVTTHSDTFLQEINNLMHTYRHPRREELMQKHCLRSDEIIDPDMARGYEFTPGEGGTHVTETRKTENGFIVPSINETLIRQRDETFRLLDGDPEDDPA